MTILPPQLFLSHMEGEFMEYISLWKWASAPAVQGPPEVISAAFAKTYDEMYRRIRAFLAFDATQELAALN